MDENKAKLVKKYEEMLKNPDKYSEEDFQEIEHQLSEDVHEVSEGLDIESEESKGEEAYPEIEKELEHEDNPEKEDEEEED
ncbi:MAG: hypothetical protein HYW24_02175 [Candidatus Aenigmarchaeota archaeon]|nr:hypothetical protein [Candidatus Aenigmarchaeota archaeon]